MAMLAEEGEFPLGLGPVRRSGGIAKVAQRPDHLGDATGIVTEDLAVLLEPAGRHGMVGRGLQMFASMPEVDHLGFGRQGLQEGPVVGGAIGDSDDPDLGACSPDFGSPRPSCLLWSKNRMRASCDCNSSIIRRSSSSIPSPIGILQFGRRFVRVHFQRNRAGVAPCLQLSE